MFDNKDLLSDNKSFAIEKMHYSKNVNMNNTHHHSHYEILYLLTGKRTLTINNFRSFELHSGNIALLSPGIIHQTTSLGDVDQTRILINISTDLMNELTGFYSQNIISCFNSQILQLGSYDTSMLKYLFTELIDLKKDSPVYEETIKINLSKILLQLCNCYYASSGESHILLTNQNVRERVDYVISYLQKNFYHDISIGMIADELYITETYLGKIFKQIMGITPYKYLLNIRVLNAKRLLESEQMSVSNVASACGFNSLIAFSRAFKLIEGISPKEYQKKYSLNKKSG